MRNHSPWEWKGKSNAASSCLSIIIALVVIELAWLKERRKKKIEDLAV